MNTNESILNQIEDTFLATFPNARFSGQVYTGCGGTPLIGFTFGIIGDTKELTSSIRENDPAFHNFLIFDEGEGKFESSALTSGISINPAEGTHYAMQHVKTKYRKTTGDSARILKSFKTFVQRLKVLIDENKSNMYQREKYSDIYFT